MFFLNDDGDGLGPYFCSYIFELINYRLNYCFRPNFIQKFRNENNNLT
jgi:hypothetical protein